MLVPRPTPPPQREFTAPRRVWYASFGSNMHRSRLDCYLTGGRPPGGLLAQPGCRDPRPPERAAPVMLPGELYFAQESSVWTGGMAFYDPDGEGRTAARAWLVTAGQFSDIAAQEMHRKPGADGDLDLRAVLASGRDRVGTGRYETLVCAGVLDGHPVLTFTAPWRRASIPGNPPAAAYLRHLASGLAESHGWSAARIAEYLATRPGAAGHWSTDAVAALLPAPPPAHGAHGEPGTGPGPERIPAVAPGPVPAADAAPVPVFEPVPETVPEPGAGPHGVRGGGPQAASPTAN